VASDREDTLKKAEKLLRQGRLEPAIAEYLRVVEAEPGDWITANTLGDLYVRAGQPDKAAAQYSRIAAHFFTEGFLPKAAALYKKLLKLTPDDEAAQLQLADISQQQGLLADAKAHLNAVAARRRSRGDRAGAAEIVVRLGSVDPNDIEARLTSARILVEMGNDEEASTRFRKIYDDLIEKDRQPEALVALREAVKLNPHDQEGRVVLAKTAVAAGDTDGARAFLDRETAGDDPLLLTALLEIELNAGQLDNARQILPQLLASGKEQRQKIVELAWLTAAADPAAAFVVVEAIVDVASAADDYSDAATMLQEFGARVPNHIPSLLKLIEICVDGGLESTMNEAQAQLADAYLTAGQGTEARVIAEDLVAREPWERDHIERFRRALVILKVSDPDSVIAERLSGMSPFMATDVFADNERVTPAVETAAGSFVPLTGSSPEPESHDGAAAESQAESQAAAAKQPEPAATANAGGTKPIPLTTIEKPSGRSDEIDLSGALGDLGEGEAATAAASPAAGPNLEEAFQGLRQEANRQGSADQSAQHMTLARTYLEMGMADQALGSLQIAVKSPRFRFEAASLLGRIHKNRGEVAQAAQWLERASEAPAPTVDDSRALVYDLATMLELSGETARALALLLELQSDAGDYRDVADRIDRLSRVETETGG
jgi:tetratricopeptide (TPR) repeat protein